MRTSGGLPARRCRSEAPLVTAASRRARRLAAAGARGTASGARGKAAGARGNKGPLGRTGSVILPVSDQHGRAGVTGTRIGDDRCGNDHSLAIEGGPLIAGA